MENGEWKLNITPFNEKDPVKQPSWSDPKAGFLIAAPDTISKAGVQLIKKFTAKVKNQ